MELIDSLSRLGGSRTAAASVFVLALVACGGASQVSPSDASPAASASGVPLARLAQAPADGVADAYDVAKMDFKSPPAVLSNERHTGPFSS